MCFFARLTWLHMASVTLEHDWFTQAKSPQEHCGPWCDWMTWWERWGWINTNNHPTTKGKNTRVHQLFKMKLLCGNTLNSNFPSLSWTIDAWNSWRWYPRWSVSDLRPRSLLDRARHQASFACGILERKLSSMAQLQIDASDTPGEIRGKYWLFAKKFCFNILWTSWRG